MIPIDLTGKVALVTGVGDNESFAWFIAKALKAAGAKIVLACHPRMMGIVDSFLTRDQDAESRKLPYGDGELKVEKVFPCDASYDTMADVPDEVKNDRRYAKFSDFSIEGMIQAVGKEFGGIDILIHSIAFSREIMKKMVDTSRKGYMEALGISAYSLTSMLRAATPFMENRPGGASAVGLTYLGGERVVPYYGGGMSTAKAALQIDARQLAHNLGPKGIRVNLISAGPYASRAARSIRPDFDESIKYAAARSPLPRGIEPNEVADATVFLCSNMASAITAQILYVDCGYHAMAV
ncbi:SDR family oxidoreductase [Telmatocola sphagniphila]|jgi:enoyl-[acyl-carrier protein] reductase I|uniref:Enoyl-[acyl-carrier-protein] reductase [NADH] n=1 Tax=Telmatocola sphagniphila TaxID=1123043 RepID=A0A8E6B3N9_9BACT|nr:SDR family oxidoreductase [Telmatocola sphagniphila]QVL31363.1 SDR family oxidoreductase [Telmatocola sphagniphila]